MKKVVLLHGFGGTSASWEPIVAMLSPEIVPYCPAISGHERPFDETSESLLSSALEQEARRLLADIEGRQMNGGLLVGYSLGARLALSMLCLEPRHFVGAILMGVNPGLSSEPQRLERVQSDDSWAVLARTVPLHTFFDHWEAQALFERQRLLPSEVLAKQREIRLTLRSDWLAEALRQFSLGRMPDYGPGAGRLPLPIRLLAGEFDQKFTMLGMLLAQVCQQGVFISVPNSGHNVLLERPDVVVNTIQELLTSLERQSHGDECDESRSDLACVRGV